LEKPKISEVPVWHAALVFIVTFFVIAFVGGILYFVGQIEAALITGEVIFLIVPLIYLLWMHVDVKNYVKISFKPKYILIGLVCGGLLIFLNEAVGYALTSVFGSSPTVQQTNELFLTISNSTPGLIAVALALGLAGICEEFAFRGFIQNVLTRYFKKRALSKYAFVPALFIAAAFFGLAHFDPYVVYTAAAFIAGLALGLIYHRWNYTVSAVAHASMNLIVLVLLLYKVG
jgi:membrane protease YdiL (CAAX protease family)